MKYRPRDQSVDYIKAIAVLLMVFQHTVLFQVSDTKSLPDIAAYLADLAPVICINGFLMMYAYTTTKNRSLFKIYKQATYLIMATLGLAVFFAVLTEPPYNILILFNFFVACLLIPYIRKIGKDGLIAGAIASLVIPLLWGLMQPLEMPEYLRVAASLFFYHTGEEHWSANMPLILSMFPVFVAVYIKKYGHSRIYLLAPAGVMAFFWSLFIESYFIEVSGHAQMTPVFILGSGVIIIMWRTISYTRRHMSFSLWKPAKRSLNYLSKHILSIYIIHQVILVLAIRGAGANMSYGSLGAQDSLIALVDKPIGGYYITACFVVTLISSVIISRLLSKALTKKV